MDVLEKYFNQNALKLALYRVNCWSDRTIKDVIGLKAFKSNLDSNLDKLYKKLKNGEYEAERGLKFYVPKASKTLRTKTLLFIDDAIVYQAIANKIAEEHYSLLTENFDFVFGSVVTEDVAKGEALLDQEEPNLFFFKYWRGLYRRFVNSVAHSINEDGAKYKFETDITGFFDSIPHYNLLSQLSEKYGVEDEVLDILGDCLDIWSGTKDSHTPGVGIPQGPAPSYFFANLLLHELDASLIGHGYKYYRYMDDIKIFGYDEVELLDALLVIDKYTKGNALSINTKKTGIEKIGEEKKAEVEKEVKRVQSFALYDIDPELIIRLSDKIKISNKGESNDNSDNEEEQKQNNDTKNDIRDVEKEIIGLSEQDANLDINFIPQTIEVLTDDEEIIRFWKNSIEEVENELPHLFENPRDNLDELRLKEEVDDIDFIKLSAQYGIAFYALTELIPSLTPNSELLKFWLFAYRRFFWRANYFGKTLSHYKNNEILKEEFLKLLENDFNKYEWVRYYLIQNLSFTQTFSDKELRQVYFQKIKGESSILAKISLYRLCFAHSKNRQFISTLNRQLKSEDSDYLKLLMTDFKRNHSGEDFDAIQFLNQMGI